MSLYAIADTHLSFGTDKPMDTFEGWQYYTDRLKKNWNRIVTDKDTVIIAGDISWAMNFTELKADFDFIEALNGKKILIKGNHDFWWSTVTKMNKFLSDNDYKTISFLHNNSYSVNNISLCGSRGWLFDSNEENDDRVLAREVMRIRRSLESAQCDEKILFLHYPPIIQSASCAEILNLLNEFGIKKCFYGHLHGEAAKYAIDGNINGIDFRLISCDKLKFTPYLILRC